VISDHAVYGQTNSVFTEGVIDSGEILDEAFDESERRLVAGGRVVGL